VIVMPVKTGIQVRSRFQPKMDSGVRRNDGWERQRGY
jgi:hypothetical protein